MDEDVLATVEGNEAEALFGVEPFHRAGLLDGCARRWPVECRRLEIRSPWRCWSSGAAIDADDFGDMWPLVSRTDTDFEGFSGLHCVDLSLSEDASMEEGVARPIG
jgi:hypothetical protein